MPAHLIQLPSAAPVNEGERLVVELLAAQLPGSYTLIPNVQIPTPGRPPYDYDLIVVAPHALYVLEIKNWKGGIVGDDFTWMVDGNYRRNNPLPTVNNKARVLKSQLKNASSAFETLWVQPLVVIVDDQGHLNIRGTARDQVVRHTALVAYLTDRDQLEGRAGDWRPARDLLVRSIQHAVRGRPLGKLRFGDYEVVETLVRRDRVAEYKARSVLLQQANLFRLRVFSYNPYLPEAEQERRKAIILRESEAIQRIGAHPNVIDVRTLFTDPNDPNLFVEVTEWSEQGTLRTLMAPDQALTLERKLELAEGIAAGLKAAHDQHVIHRDVRPENVLIGRDNQPKVMNFDYARIPLPGGITVGPPQHDPDEPRAYLAPELLTPGTVPTPAADVYGLGMLLFELLVGEPAFPTPEQALKDQTAGGGPGDYGVPDVPPRLNDLIRGMVKVDPAARIQGMDEVLAEIQAIRKLPSGTLEQSAPATSVPEPSGPRLYDPHLYEVDDKIQGKYLVQKRLSAGGYGQVYRVYDELTDRVWALKVYSGGGDLAMEALRAEIRTLLDLSHPNIVRVHDWGILQPSGRLFLVSELVDGEDLRRYASPNPEQRLQLRETVAVVIDVLEALASIHPPMDQIEELERRRDAGELEYHEFQQLQQLKEQGHLHRDIKPENIMLTRAGRAKLIDFNIARKAADARQTYVGTPHYMLPTVGSQMAERWSSANDLFALALVLYELVSGQHPFYNRDPACGYPPTDPRTYVPDLHPRFAELLLRAVNHAEHTVYRNARRFQAALEALNGVYRAPKPLAYTPTLLIDPDEQGRPNYNPFVTRLLRLYSQARRDNGGTRGLDDLARLTYVETRLDLMLRPAILEGRYRLVIITGNAGDGKTAFIKSLEHTVTENGGAISAQGENASTFTYNGVRFVTNYDGSQDEGAERANDLVLEEFFRPFDDGHFGAPAATLTHVIAINEGRLLDFFAPGHPAATGFGQLGGAIRAYFDPDQSSSPPDWLLIVDLNQRSVVAPDSDAPARASIFERQLQVFLKPELWQACGGCAFYDGCPIRHNAATLADPAAGPAVRERLRTLFEIVHLRRQMHITMRDLRSALAWLIAHDHSCADIARLHEQHTPPRAWLELLYINAFAANGHPPEGRGDDRLVRLLRQVDPAEVANPSVDRTLHFHGLDDLPMLAFEQRRNLARDWLDEWCLPTGWSAGSDPVTLADQRARHAVLRRVAFYEQRGDAWQQMLPYHQLELFRAATCGNDEARAKTTQLLVKGISLAEGARDPQQIEQYICIRSGKGGRRIKSFRLFPAGDFMLRIPPPRGAAYVEYTADRVLFIHQPQAAADQVAGARPAELSISLDLLELLAQIQDGFTPSADAISGLFINLVIFKHALAHLPYRRLVLTRDDGQYYEVVQDGTTMTLRKQEKVAHEAQP